MTNRTHDINLQLNTVPHLSFRQLEVRRLEPFEAAAREMELRLQDTEQSCYGQHVL